MLGKPHFRNGLKCRPVHNHGASCAVDVLLDTYYFGIYEYSKKDTQIYDRTSSMVQRLEAVCQFRDAFGSASCDLREEMWDWCVSNLAKAYAPKGRGDAEVLEGFAAFADNANSTVKITTESICSTCTQNLANMSSVSVVSITSTISVKCAGHLGKSVEMQIGEYARNCQSRPCSAQPNVTVNPKLIEMSWPNILIVEIGIVDHLNRQTPPAQIEQCMTVGNYVYELAAAVQAEPGHFYCISRIGNQYGVIDGLKDRITYFDTFTAAVHKDNTLTQHMHSTTMTHHAIHILIFRKRLASCSTAVGCSNVGCTTTGEVSSKASNISASRIVTVSANNLSPNCPSANVQSTTRTKSTTTSGSVSTTNMSDGTGHVAHCSQPSSEASNILSSTHTKSTTKSGSVSTTNMSDGTGHVAHCSQPSSEAANIQSSTHTKSTTTSGSVSTTNMSDGSGHVAHCSQPSSEAVNIQSSTHTKSTTTSGSVSTTNMSDGTGHVAHCSQPSSEAANIQSFTHTKCTTTSGSVSTTNMSDGTRHVTHCSQPSSDAANIQSSTHTKSTTTSGSVSMTNMSAPGGTGHVAHRNRPSSEFDGPQSCVHAGNDGPASGMSRTAGIADRYIHLGVGKLKVVKDSGNIFFLCKDVFHYAEMTTHVSKNGYKSIDQVLRKAGLEPERCFHFYGSRRNYIRKDALASLLQSGIGNSIHKTQMATELEKSCAEPKFVNESDNVQTVSVQEASCDVYDRKMKTMVELAKAGGATMITGHFSLSCGKVRYSTKQNIIYLCCTDIFQLCGIAKHLKHTGYAILDRQLGKLGLSDAFILSGKQRLVIQLTAVLELLNDGLSRSHLSPDNVDKIRKELIAVMESETCIDMLKRRNMATPKRNKLASPISVNRSPFWRKKRHRTLFPSIRKSSSLKHKTEQLKSAMKSMCEKMFKNKNEFMSAFAKLISTDKEHTAAESDEFDGIFTASSITQILKKVDYKPPVRSRYSNFLEHVASESINTCISADDIIYIEENFSGTRLMEQLRLKLPTVLPTMREERALKKKYNSQFKAILLPQRTSTGWCVDPGRLMELLSFKYWWLPEEKHWKVYGDGRAIGGRQSCFIALSTLNNEARLHDISYQSPKEIYPVVVFYESDSRDNLEENLGFPSKLDSFILEKQRSNNAFYLAGDEMFLEAMLASEGLGPLTRNGWNIYRSDETEQKRETSQATGMRTDLNLGIDREHPDGILSSIPTCKVVLCILHALARCVEKFINLEVDNILSEGNKAGQRGHDSTAFVEEKIQNLQNNINKRGVRGGQFRIHFNSKGTPEPVSLNKTLAMVIISCPPTGDEAKYPHVLTHVLDSQKQLVNPVSDTVKQKLMLENTYSEFEMVRCIWDHFSKMIAILQKDPEPEILIGRPEYSLQVDDYSWGYSDDDKSQYIFHAESFYHLYVSRYTYKALTPYMMKLIDIVPIFMKTLPFPLARFDSEGGEHLNYEHNRFYFQHTTRHGGKDKPDPLLSLFKSMFHRLAYTIGHDDTLMDKEARSCFSIYCRRHEAAAIIQRQFRAFLGRNQHNVSRPAVKTIANPRHLFTGFTFVLCGNIPKHGSKKCTQAAFKVLLLENGARVRTKLPGEGKGVSTKKYTVIASPNMLQHSKIVGPIRQAVRKGLNVLNYTFITSSIDTGKLSDPSVHIVDVTKLSTTVTKHRSLQDRHFSKSVSLLTKLKKRRKKRMSKLKKRADKKPVRSAALHYVLSRRTQLQDGKRVSFWQSRKNLLSLFNEWKSLPQPEKAKAKEEWQREKNEQIEKLNQNVCMSQAQTYNLQTKEPAYQSFFKAD